MPRWTMGTAIDLRKFWGPLRHVWVHLVTGTLSSLPNPHVNPDRHILFGNMNRLLAFWNSPTGSLR